MPNTQAVSAVAPPDFLQRACDPLQVASIEALPDTSSLPKDEILIMSRQRYKFDRCFEAAGAKLVDWGAPAGPISIDEMVAAIGPRTCAVAYGN